MFSSFKESAVPVGESILQIGVYIWIDRSWKQHPFLTNNFLIKNEQELKQLRFIGTENIYWIPHKSKSQPLPKNSEPIINDASVTDDNQLLDVKQKLDEKEQEVRRQRALISKAERQWEKSSALVKESLTGLKNNPKQHGASLIALTKSVSENVIDTEAMLLLMVDKKGEGLQYHSLNTMTLSVLLAKALKLPEILIREVAIGALAHDVGETLLPSHIFKTSTRTKAEENLYRDHIRLGVDIANMSGVFSPLAISVIKEHHEFFDGSGFPDGKKENAISIPARIVSIVNRYDRLCSPSSKDTKPMLPGDAIRKMWNHEKAKYDPGILAAFIKLLGVYPPGTIVRLNTSQIALVVSPGKSSLHPKVLIYDPKLTKEEAEITDLDPDGVIVIDEAIKPSEIETDILTWMNLKGSSIYYYMTDEL